MSRTLRRGLAVLGVALAVGSIAWVAVRGPEPPQTLQERVAEVAGTLRCPVCQDLSVADSPSTVALQMRASIAEDLAAGTPPDQIRASFVRSYGDWILLSPPTRGLGMLPWLAPVVVLAAGVALVVRAIRRWRRAAGTISAAPDDPSKAAGVLTTGDHTALAAGLASLEAEGDDPWAP